MINLNLKSESENSDIENSSNITSDLPKTPMKPHMSDSESEPNEPKSSALAVLAKNKKKLIISIVEGILGGKEVKGEDENGK